MLDNLKNRTRIYLGYGVIVVLGLGTAGFGILQITDVATPVVAAGVLSTHISQVLNAPSDSEAAGRTESRYRSDGNEAGPVTATATEETGVQIAWIRAATKEAVLAVRAEIGTVGQVSPISISTSIAKAVEEQRAAMVETARNMRPTAQSAHEMTMNIGDATRAATGEFGAAGDLSHQAQNLTSKVDSFIARVRAA